MGEIAALSTAFDKEFNKAHDALPVLGRVGNLEHDAHLNKYRWGCSRPHHWLCACQCAW